MLDKKDIENIDIPLIIGVLLLSIIGILTVHAASRGYSISQTYYLRMQSIWVILGIIGAMIVVYFDYRDFGGVIYIIYAVNLLLLITVLFAGRTTLGAQRWIDIGPFGLQPSEFAKVAVIITLGHLMSREDLQIVDLFDLVRPGIHVAIPMALIFLQPDLGTSLVFVAITFGMLYAAGLKWKYITLLGATGSAVAVFAFHKILKEYQQIRLIVFRDPYKYYHKGGWQIIQSKIAIGSGRIFGNGFLQGTQTELRFVPEAHTDFVFSVIGEQFGLIGTSIVLFLFLFVIYRILHIGMQASDNYGTYMCVGVAALLIFQVLVNVGMTLSMMPVTGLPLPFITYGGSTTLSSMLAIGLVINVGLRRDRKTIF